MYQVAFSRRAEKDLLALPDNDVKRVKEAIDKLRQNPRTYGTIKLEDGRIATYRFRAGDVRILFDIDDRARVIEVVGIRKRDEHTYR